LPGTGQVDELEVDDLHVVRLDELLDLLGMHALPPVVCGGSDPAQLPRYGADVSCVFQKNFRSGKRARRDGARAREGPDGRSKLHGCYALPARHYIACYAMLSVG